MKKIPQLKLYLKTISPNTTINHEFCITSISSNINWFNSVVEKIGEKIGFKKFYLHRSSGPRESRRGRRRRNVHTALAANLHGGGGGGCRGRWGASKMVGNAIESWSKDDQRWSENDRTWLELERGLERCDQEERVKSGDDRRKFSDWTLSQAIYKKFKCVENVHYVTLLNNIT